jgi:hypothetical protein
VNFNTKDFVKAKIINCVSAPLLPGQRPKQAIFVPDIPDCDGYIHIPTGNAWLNFHKFKRVFLIGVGNIAGSEVFWEEEHGTIEDTPTTNGKEAPKPRGRPKLHPTEPTTSGAF